MYDLPTKSFPSDQRKTNVKCLIEKSEHLASGSLSSCLVVIYNAECGGQYDVTEATGWEDILNPLLDFLMNYTKVGMGS
jgi:hypothetical protein